MRAVPCLEDNTPRTAAVSGFARAAVQERTRWSAKLGQRTRDRTVVSADCRGACTCVTRHSVDQTALVADAALVRVCPAGRLQLAGQAWLPRGVNSYPLLQHAAAGRSDAILDIFAQASALDRPLLRMSAFLDRGEGPGRTRDTHGNPLEAGLCALDSVLALAADSGMRLILILANYWADFGGVPALLHMLAPGDRLPKEAFFTDDRAIAAQLAYQDALVSRINHVNGRCYAHDPTILAWELMNEARSQRWLARYRGAPRMLARWARRMSDGLRAAGARQLIAWGGAGHLGEHGEDMRALAAEGGVDILTLHMYGNRVRATWGKRRADAAIAWGERHLRSRSRIARAAGLPLLLEEVNWKAASRADDERARVLGAWLEIARSLDVGTLPWMIGEAGRPDYDGYLIRPEDHATRSVLRRCG